MSVCVPFIIYSRSMYAKWFRLFCSNSCWPEIEEGIIITFGSTTPVCIQMSRRHIGYLPVFASEIRRFQLPLHVMNRGGGQRDDDKDDKD